MSWRTRHRGHRRRCCPTCRSIQCDGEDEGHSAMKEQLKKADLFGLAIIAATLIVYSTRSVWTMYQTIAAAVGGLLVVISIVLKLPDIRAGLGRRSTKFGIHSATSVILVLGILAFINYLGAQHSKVV